MMDFSFLIDTAKTAATYKTGYDAAQREQEEIAAKSKKLNYISLGASAVGAIVGVLYASSAGKSKLGYGLLGFMVTGTLTVIVGSLILAKQLKK
jgi:hypothetical protein